ncbi:succinate dehydrogenase assembly factor 4, mitochondrial-like [Ctenocephalides felis]|uniref:succinate dehydrogenase assembly factor 4, mitochondrial-like n=1 Tax=Ctenocephalides felis TaxID=7515 RepID=UPI000E6E5640|nr:succinate dehydrogenase assembly factor 4, mitochondrial-like [Ctenocephalides felis]
MIRSMTCIQGRALFQLTAGVRMHSSKPSPDSKPVSPRIEEFRKKLREKTPIGKLDELDKHPYQEKEPLPPWPDNTNPHTGEIGGPRGPEPTRYGDWERKGKVSDF